MTCKLKELLPAFIIFICNSLYGQIEYADKIYSNLKIDFKGRVAVDIIPDSSYLHEGYAVDIQKIKEMISADNWPTFALADYSTGDVLLEFYGSSVQALRYGIRLVIDDLNNEIINQLKTMKSRLYIISTDTLKLPLKNNANEFYLFISPALIKETTAAGIIKITENQAQEIIKRRGGEIFMYSNKIDFGKNADITDSSKTEYSLSINYSYKPAVNLLKWNTIILNTRVSTRSENSLNQVKFYPITYNFVIGKNAVSRLAGQVGVEGNQRFTIGRISANFFWEGLIPNFIDMTAGYSRLRLKPLLVLGLKGLKEFDNTRNEKNRYSGEIYSNLYYYIPVMDYYSILFEGYFFYMLNGNIASNKYLRWNYSAALGVEIPGADLKIIAKYVFGETDVSFIKNEQLVIGLMVDLFTK